MDKTLEYNKVKFLDLTHKLNDYNEIYNVNTYLQGAYGMELERLLATNNDLKTHLLRMKQEYMTNESGINAYRFRTNVVYFTILVVSVILMITALFTQGKLGARMLFIICAVIIVIYFIIVLIMIKSNNERRYYAYNQFYWYPIKPKVDSSTF